MYNLFFFSGKRHTDYISGRHRFPDIRILICSLISSGCITFILDRSNKADILHEKGQLRIILQQTVYIIMIIGRLMIRYIPNILFIVIR